MIHTPETEITVSMQGGRDSFHDIGARQLFGPDVRPLHCTTFEEVFESVISGQADKGLVAIWNSSYGDILKVYKLISEHVGIGLKELLEHDGVLNGGIHFPDTDRLWIEDEMEMQINHHLIGVPGAKLDEITSVHSQPPALEQCLPWIKATLPNAERVEEDDTAGSVLLVRDWGDRTKAAIASRAAAYRYGMEVLASDIQSPTVNQTRFIVISHFPTESDQQWNKTYLSFIPHDAPNALADALTQFGGRNINIIDLPRIPVPGQPRTKEFFIEPETGLQEQRMKEALVSLRRNNYDVRVLGSVVSCDKVLDSSLAPEQEEVA